MSSPTFAGFKAGVGYSTRIDGAETAPSSNNTKATIFGANWASGPFFAAITYDVRESTSTTPRTRNTCRSAARGTSAPVRLHAAWANQANIGAISTPDGRYGFVH